MKKTFIVLLLTSCLIPVVAVAQDKPNVVLILMDNFGWGELGVYGGGVLRGAPTPRIDELANEGMRLLNFNVEAQCTPSRAALMTGRYAVRTGNGSVPIDTPLYGLTQWEYTLAEMLSDAGYTSGMFGKWHLGHTKGRFPTDQGFDEWYGVPNSTDESYWPDNPLYRPDSHAFAKPSYVMEGNKGEEPRNVTIYDSRQRLLIDKELTDKSIDFMRRHASDEKPFFLYVPYTQTHLPVLPHPEFRNKTRNGHFADVLAQVDAYVGQLLDEVDSLGIRKNTIFIFTSDNGPEMLVPHHGSSGPWRGTYFTGLEGSLRVPFIIRWPGQVPKGAVNNEIVHEMDLYPTLANIAGGKLRDDRVIDGIDQVDFFTGQQTNSNRESFVVYVGNELYGVKWRDWKMMTKEIERGAGEFTKQYGLPLFYNLLTDPREEHPMDPRLGENFWVRYPAGQVLVDHAVSLQEEPPIQPGTPDPYKPPRR